MTILENNVDQEPVGGKKVRAILLLGGNVGNVKQAFSRAYELLESKVSIVNSSSIYRTQSWGMNATDFLNQVVIIDTFLTAFNLLNFILNIEAAIGRKRKKHKIYESRIIDIDILFFGDQIIEESGLTIPHPQIEQRRFALVPLVETLPEFRHPVTGIKMKELLRECPDQLEVEKY